MRYNIKVWLGFLVLFAALSSCDKHRAKKLSGEYHCKVDYLYWDTGSNKRDSTFYEDVRVSKNEKYVIIFGERIHIDELWKDETYKYEDVNESLTVRFNGDRLYIRRYYGGQGSHTILVYDGLKKPD